MHPREMIPVRGAAASAKSPRRMSEGPTRDDAGAARVRQGPSGFDPLLMPSVCQCRRSLSLTAAVGPVVRQRARLFRG